MEILSKGRDQITGEENITVVWDFTTRVLLLNFPDLSLAAVTWAATDVAVEADQLTPEARKELKPTCAEYHGSQSN